MDLHIWMLAFLIIFMLHNLEEIITIENWFKKTYPKIINKIPLSTQKELQTRKDITSIQFSVIIFVFSTFVSVLILLAIVTQHDYVFLGVSLFFALNLFTHPLQSLFLRCYTPGVLTSLLFIIPYYCLFFYYNPGIFSIHMLLKAIPVILVLIPMFLISHQIGNNWGNR